MKMPRKTQAGRGRRSVQRMVSRRSPAVEKMLKAYRLLWEASAESEEPYRRIALAGVRVLIERDYQRTNGH
jgi:hypothetical protein